MTISKIQRTLFLLICISFLSACATTSQSPSSTANSVSFGEKPIDYKQIINTYLEKKRKGKTLDLSKTHFLNEPNKYVFQRLGQEKFGYRVCTLIPIKEVNKLQSHFFLINNGKVTKHLYDSGLISLSSKFCNSAVLALEEKVKAKTAPAAAVVTTPVDEDGFKYISCQAKDNEMFFAFNPEKQQLLQQHDGKQVATFDIEKLSDTYIVATTKGSRISINRISGTMIYKTEGNESKANCELTSKQRF